MTLVRRGSAAAIFLFKFNIARVGLKHDRRFFRANYKKQDYYSQKPGRHSCFSKQGGTVEVRNVIYMIYINEWFPNPIGTDTCKANCGWNVEWVELYNSGDAPVSLSGWSLWTGGKTKPVPLGGIVPAHGYAMLKKPDIKISLKNTDGGLWLYGPEGKLVDHAAFKGAAPEGKSFSRVLYNSATDNVPGATSAGANIQAFAFVNPTPGARNQKINNQVAVQHHPTGTPLNPPITGMEIAGLAFGAALTIFAAWAYVIKTNEAISNIIFPRNAGDRGIDRAPY